MQADVVLRLPGSGWTLWDADTGSASAIELYILLLRPPPQAEFVGSTYPWTPRQSRTLRPRLSIIQVREQDMFARTPANWASLYVPFAAVSLGSCSTASGKRAIGCNLKGRRPRQK